MIDLTLPHDARGATRYNKQRLIISNQQRMAVMVVALGGRTVRLRRRRGETVRLGGARRRGRVAVRWASLRWRLVAEVLGPMGRMLVEIVGGRHGCSVQSPALPPPPPQRLVLALPFVCNFPLPLAM